MQQRTDKSVNQLWREQKKSGQTNLGFKEWLATQKAKNFSNITGVGAVPVNSSLNSGIQDIIQADLVEGGLQTTAGSTYVFGINKQYLLWGAIGIGMLLTGIIIYKIVHRK